MNKINPALDCFLNAFEDILTLQMFKPPQLAQWRNHHMKREDWDAHVRDRIKIRLLECEYVIIHQFAVYLTVKGKEILAYRESGPGPARV